MSRRSPITCHVLDTSTGKPAQEIPVALSKLHADFTEEQLAVGQTDSDGRCISLLKPEPLQAGLYRISFEIEQYFQNRGQECLYPVVQITFRLNDPSEHYHIPVLISPFSYTTYRGS